MAFGSLLCLYLWEGNECAPACSVEEIDKEEVPMESSSNFRSYSKSYSKFGFTIHNIAPIVMRSLSIFNDGDAWSRTLPSISYFDPLIAVCSIIQVYLKMPSQP